jgi:hypothetical protein
MKPTRKQVLEWIRYHASKGDIASAQRLYIENRISSAAYQEAIKRK